MAIKKISTEFQLLDKFLDTSGDAGSANQVLVSTATGINWVDGSGSGIIGGPYLPLSAGSGKGLTGQLWFTGVTDANRKIFFTNAGTYAKGSMDAASYAFQVSGSEKLTILSSGNVGIGTTNPSVKLDIAGTDSNYIAKFTHSTASGYAPGSILLEAGQSTNRGQGIYHYNNVADENWFTGVPYSVSSKKWIVANLYSTAQDVTTAQLQYALLTIDSDTGNVGIGTSSPSNKLHVNSGTTNEVAKFESTDGTAYLSIMDSNTTNSLQGIGSAGDELTFYSNNAERMRIDSSGNVGIGTTAPGTKLEISDNTAPTLTLRNPSANPANAGMIRFIESTNTDGFQLTFDGSDNKLKFISDSSGTEVTRMVIQRADGNVGIGTTSPTAKLEIEGDATSNDTAQLIVASGGVDNNSIIHFTDDEGSQVNAIGSLEGNILTLASQNELVFKTGTSSILGNTDTRMTILTNGNVGIGTTGPGDKLDVNGTVRAKAPATSDWAFVGYNSASTASSGLWFDNGDGELLLRDDSNALNVRIRSDAASYFNGGSIGIGTTSPNLKLDVISGSNNGIRISATDTTSNWRDISIRSYVTEAEADALTDHTHFFTTNPSGATETAFSKYGGTVIQGRDDGNSSFAIRLGNGGGYATRMFMDAVGVTTFSNTVTATNFILSSDKRLKKNVKEVDNKHIDVDWKTFEMKSDKGQKRYGVIAQELEKVHPEFVRTDEQGMKSVAYIDLLIAKIAELEARLDKAGI